MLQSLCMTQQQQEHYTALSVSLHSMQSQMARMLSSKLQLLRPRKWSSSSSTVLPSKVSLSEQKAKAFLENAFSRLVSFPILFALPCDLFLPSPSNDECYVGTSL